MTIERANTPTQSLADSINNIIESKLIDVHTGFPAKVQSFDSELQEADIIPVIKRKKRNTQTPEFANIPLLPSVPVIYPSSSEAALYFPLQKDDYVWVVVAERSLDGWRPQGNIQANPAIPRKFDLSDVYCIPGASPDNARLPSTIHGDALVLHFKGKELRIADDGDIFLGSEGSTVTEPFVLGNQLKLKLEEILDILIAGDHTLTTSPGSPTAPNPTRATEFNIIKNALNDTLSTTIKGE
jgi:hypothetical protein